MNTEKNIKMLQGNGVLSDVMGGFLLMLFNAGGTIAWVHLYTSGRFTEWWVFSLITVCGMAALIFASKFAKSIHRGGLF